MIKSLVSFFILLAKSLNHLHNSPLNCRPVTISHCKHCYSECCYLLTFTLAASRFSYRIRASITTHCCNVVVIYITLFISSSLACKRCHMICFQYLLPWHVPVSLTVLLPLSTSSSLQSVLLSEVSPLNLGEPLESKFVLFMKLLSLDKIVSGCLVAITACNALSIFRYLATRFFIFTQHRDHVQSLASIWQASHIQLFFFRHHPVHFVSHLWPKCQWSQLSLKCDLPLLKTFLTVI